MGMTSYSQSRPLGQKILRVYVQQMVLRILPILGPKHPEKVSSCDRYLRNTKSQKRYESTEHFDPLHMPVKVMDRAAPGNTGPQRGLESLPIL